MEAITGKWNSGPDQAASRLNNRPGIKQICIGVNKMDCDTAAHKQTRYDEIANEMKSMLAKVEVVFSPTHRGSNPCAGKVLTVAMHHQRGAFASPSNNVGPIIKGLD